MSLVLDAEPIVVADVDEAPPCGYSLCEERAVWSVLWSCSESTLYCETHLRWAQRVQPVSCTCPGVDWEVPILIVAVMPL